MLRSIDAGLGDVRVRGQDGSGASSGAYQAADERVHGVVEGPEEEDGSGQPQDAQFGDLQEARRRVEAAHRDGEEAVHRRGQEAEVGKSFFLFGKFSYMKFCKFCMIEIIEKPIKYIFDV